VWRAARKARIVGKIGWFDLPTARPSPVPKKERRVAGTLSPPLFRDLRGYALDPSLALQLETAPISEVLFRVPWEPLEPGPVGEYLEVVDFDPAGRCFYE